MRSPLVALVSFVLATASCAEAEDPQGSFADVGVEADVGGFDGSTSPDADSGAAPDDGVVEDSASGDTSVEDVAIDGGASDTGAGDTGASDGAADSAPPLDDSPSCHPVVNEVMVAGATSGDEFVELYNPCAFSVALVDHRLVYLSASGTSDQSLVDLAGYTMPPGGYLVFEGPTCTVCGTTDGTMSGGDTGVLAAAGGGLAIKKGTTVVDSVGYGTATNAFVEGSAAPAPAASSAIARKPNGVDTGDNSADFVVQTPTPGAPN